jgi:hypothetical protein
MSPNAEKSCLDPGTSYQATRLYTKADNNWQLTTADRIHLQEGDSMAKIFLRVNFEENY